MTKRPGVYRNRRQYCYHMVLYGCLCAAIAALVWFAIACFAAVMS